MFCRKFLSFLVLLFFGLGLISPCLGKLDIKDPDVCIDFDKPVPIYKIFSSRELKCCEFGFEEVDGKCKRKSNDLSR